MVDGKMYFKSHVDTSEVFMLKIGRGKPWIRSQTLCFMLLIAPVSEKEGTFRMVGLGIIDATDDLAHDNWELKTLMII
jgi:hypothetical protein